MTEPLLPLITEADELERKIDDENLVIIDLSRAPIYARNHIPDAVHIEYSQIVSSKPPVMGLLPSAEDFSKVLSTAGISPESHVVAYDDEGGAKACRLLWTLDVAGHKSFSLLNGGLQAWVNEDHSIFEGVETAIPTEYNVTYCDNGIITKAEILTKLGDPNVALLDVRSPGEYAGTDKRAARSGHIPGAVNLEWIHAIDQQFNLRLKEPNELQLLYIPLDVMPDKEVIVYCHSHHRSAHSYIALKSLGYKNLKGYPGSWSDWGNDPDTPVE